MNGLGYSADSEDELQLPPGTAMERPPAARNLLTSSPTRRRTPLSSLLEDDHRMVRFM